MPVTIKVNGTANSLVHKGSNGISTATIPDVCKTPSPGGPVPIPYPNISQSATLAKGTTTVKTDGMMAAIKGSEFSLSNGDEAGVAGGVKSSTFIKESTWILYSFDVKMDGEGTCRLTDKKFQNHENTADLAGEIQAALGVSHAEFCDLCKNCQGAADEELESSKFMQNEYRKAGADAKNKTGRDIENAVKKSIADQGFTTSVAGTTDTSGNITVAPTTDPCGKVREAATMAHEKVHQATQKALQKKFGVGTPAFSKAWNNGQNWAQDEVNAYAADQKFINQFKSECKSSCP
jgi:uncharacterized Zn-binding protein involved in type VI secretion